MIVVINPSGSAGRSFKGLHAYCAHDQDRADTSERVEWMDMRNLAANDPEQAWKVMAATAGAQNELKRAAGIRAGRTSKDGAVMHVVLSFDKDEPVDSETMQAAADGFLSQLGADPAKMRGKAKPKRRQFADEHQVVMYAHRDTDNAHLHLMINTVHPEHGVKLPTSNNQIKAQKWALEFSKEYGTDKKTPAREENAELRAQGEYVKGERRKSRNAYEQEQQAKDAANDNGLAEAALKEQRAKDAALAQRGRDLAEQRQEMWAQVTDDYRGRKAALARQLQTDINKVKAETRETFRPRWRELREFQVAERQTFDELERSFFGRASNMAKALRLSSDDVSDGRTNTINRAFKIITNAGERQVYFDAAQERSRSALQREQAAKVAEASQALKDAQGASQARQREEYFAARAATAEKHAAEAEQLKTDWKARGEERQVALDDLAAKSEARKKLQDDYREAHRPAPDPRADLLADYAAQSEFERAAKSKTTEQDNERDRNWDITDDD